jgi:hypothetical protein
VEYVIRAFDQQAGQIVVEYAGKWTYAIDLPIVDNAYPIGEALEKIIQDMAPTLLQERETAIAQSPTNADVIAALVQPYPVVEEVVTPATES